MEYEYELRKAGEVVATGRITDERTLAPGDRLSIGHQHGIISSVVPAIAGRVARLTVELARSD